MKYKNIAIFVLVMFSAVAHSVTEQVIKTSNSNILTFRSHSASHSVAGAENMSEFELAGLTDGCTSIFFYNDKDPFLYATVLAGINRLPVIDVTIIYDVDSRGSWNNSACKLTSFTIHK